MSEAWSKWEGRVVNGEFQLKKYLGGSEQSAVFLVDDLVREFQPAAIKLISSDRSDAHDQLSRWRLAQGLSHPHLIRIFRTGLCQLHDHDFIFAVMEYAEENLTQVLPDRALTSQEVREMLGPALDALGYLHNQGLVHGSLKPANVLAMKDQLKLTCDSICSAGESASAPRTTSVYDPPEMAAGKKSQSGDVWSLGVTLVEVLTRRLPLRNEKDSADPILLDTLPVPFAEIVRGCLRRDPESRFTIADIAAKLHGKPLQPARAANVLTSAPRPAAAARAARPWVWQSAFPAALAVLGIAALLAGFGFLRHSPEHQP
jgi:eukaryotic-like serine/threonine-protein kinase